jgi:hypothetical protein
MPASRFAAAAVAGLLGVMPAQSACTIVVNASGVMVTNPAIDLLSSTAAGGSAASATVTTNGFLCSLLGLLNCYEISVVAPAGFQTAPVGGGTGVTFASSYSVGGGALLLGLIPTTLLNGTYVVTANLTASRAAGVFPAGGYEAVSTIRCE